MFRYYVEKNACENGDHAVHREGCAWLPPEEGERVYLGEYEDCFEAVRAAKRLYPSAHGCWHCARKCHLA